MYVISLIIFVLAMVFVMLLGAPFTAYVDAPSILMIVLMTVPMLMASGLLPDFKRAFRVMMTKSNLFTEEELKKSLLAVRLTTQLVMFSGLFGTLIGGISMLGKIDQISKIGPSVAVMVLTIFYAFCFVIILLPVQAKIKSLLISFESKN